MKLPFLTACLLLLVAGKVTAQPLFSGDKVLLKTDRRRFVSAYNSEGVLSTTSEGNTTPRSDECFRIFREAGPGLIGNGEKVYFVNRSGRFLNAGFPSLRVVPKPDGNPGSDELFQITTARLSKRVLNGDGVRLMIHRRIVNVDDSKGGMFLLPEGREPDRDETFLIVFNGSRQHIYSSLTISPKAGGLAGSLSSSLELLDVLQEMKTADQYSTPRSFNMMEPPELHRVGQEFSGQPVYFVNGINNSFDDAVQSALQLSKHLKRTVDLLYSPSETVSSTFVTDVPLPDILEASNDRNWPKSRFFDMGIQPNRAVRQLAYLLYHSSTNISVITHSQGGLLMRNALMIAHECKPKTRVVERVKWVAAGIPLPDSGIYNKPEGFIALENPLDFVSHQRGVERRMFVDGPRNLYLHMLLIFTGVQHEPVGHSFPDYLHKIEPSFIWPP